VSYRKRLKMFNKLKLYKDIVTIRTFEEKLDHLIKRGLVGGTAHVCVGQEFVPSIISQLIASEDVFTSTHRGHGHAIAKGLNLKKFLSEIMGLEHGYCKGRGGTQHTMSKEFNFIANGITGGMVPVGVGIAFSLKYLGKDDIVVSFTGDGAMNEGYVVEAMNIASVQGLPILFICENNQYAMSTRVENSFNNDIYRIPEAKGIESKKIEKNDYEQFYTISKDYIDKIRKDKKPRFIEIQTYRHKGHSKSDTNKYRSKDEEKQWFDLDVLNKLEKEIDPGEIIKIKKQISDEFDKIVEEINGNVQ